MSVKDLVLKASISAYEARRNLHRKIILGLLALAPTVPGMAFADGDIASMGDDAATGAKDLEKDALYAAEFIGVLFLIGGFIAGKNKKDNPQIKTGHIVGSVLFGVLLISASEMVKRSQSQMGLTQTTVGSGS